MLSYNINNLLNVKEEKRLSHSFHYPHTTISNNERDYINNIFIIQVTVCQRRNEILETANVQLLNLV